MDLTEQRSNLTCGLFARLIQIAAGIEIALHIHKENLRPDAMPKGR
jgi:hypothetical protein